MRINTLSNFNGRPAQTCAHFDLRTLNKTIPKAANQLSALAVFREVPQVFHPKIVFTPKVSVQLFTISSWSRVYLIKHSSVENDEPLVNDKWLECSRNTLGLVSESLSTALLAWAVPLLTGKCYCLSRWLKKMLAIRILAKASALTNQLSSALL